MFRHKEKSAVKIQNPLLTKRKPYLIMQLSWSWMLLQKLRSKPPQKWIEMKKLRNQQPPGNWQSRAAAMRLYFFRGKDFPIKKILAIRQDNA